MGVSRGFAIAPGPLRGHLRSGLGCRPDLPGGFAIAPWNPFASPLNQFADFEIGPGLPPGPTRGL